MLAFRLRTSTILRAALAAGIGLAAAPAAHAATILGPEPTPGVTRPAILVGNNWDGTTDIVDPETYERLDRVNVVPDKSERLAEIMFDPVKQGFFIGVRELIGEGNDQFNDDVFSSNDGRTIYVSRPSFADVVAIDLASKNIVWRAPVDGYRSDHMAINAQGTRLLVSASTGNIVHELDTATGARVGGFPSGDSPHENTYSKDGSKVYHASIGRVYLPTDRPSVIDSASKGGQYFQVVDAKTNEILKRIDMGEKLAEAGYPGLSSAVRPMTLSPDEKYVYFQVSFFHGFIEYDLTTDKVTRVARLPISEEAAKLMPEQYLLDSAHHGIALDKKGEKLCVAGTMSDYGAIVDRETFAARILDVGKKPYWSTNSADGESCYVSASQNDWVSVIDYKTEKIVHRIPVGRHPQRVRNGVVRVADYPQGKYGEAFDLEMFTSRQPVSFRGGDENFGCRAAKAQKLRLASCRVDLRARVRGAKKVSTIARGTRTVSGRRSFKVDVNLTRTGKALLKRRPGGVRVTARLRGVDSIGRVRTVSKRITIRTRR
ncbi:YncE family protein [Paraconexibacter sp.]|uniref:YncE family protein n=1 Tax=Paraconexibacter sp. TaxID=2949640 RepID=UPI00356B3061